MAPLTVGDQVCGTPSYPGLRLWADSMTALLEHRRADATPMADYSSKQRIAPRTLDGSHVSRKIDAVLVLQAPSADDKTTLQRQTPQQRCMALMSHSFQLDPGNMRHAQRLLAVAAAVARRLPVLSLGYPRDYAALPRVITDICRILPVSDE